MRKFIVFVMALFTFGSATAETMCVKLDASQNCTYEYPGYFTSDWTTTCSGVPISGIAYCSNQRAAYKDKSDTITISGDTAEENRYCWCRMISPAVSSWVFNNDHGYASYCAQVCADDCASRAARFSDFRWALFSDLH